MLLHAKTTSTALLLFEDPKLLLNLVIAPYRKKQSLLLFFSCFLATILFAQQKITGIVTGVNDVPLSGATITIKDSKIASATNADGSFAINAKPEDVLIISFVGYNSKQFTVGNETFFKISLTLTVNDLDQVVVTGYTSQKIKEITGSVAVVRSKDLIAVPAGQVEQMLQGRVAGLTVINSQYPEHRARFISMELATLEMLLHFILLTE